MAYFLCACRRYSPFIRFSSSDRRVGLGTREAGCKCYEQETAAGDTQCCERAACSRLEQSVTQDTLTSASVLLLWRNIMGHRFIAPPPPPAPLALVSADELSRASHTSSRSSLPVIVVVDSLNKALLFLVYGCCFFFVKQKVVLPPFVADSQKARLSGINAGNLIMSFHVIVLLRWINITTSLLPGSLAQ